MHDHAHHHVQRGHGGPAASRRALSAALGITGVVFVAEVVGGVLSGRWRFWPTRCTCFPMPRG